MIGSVFASREESSVGGEGAHKREGPFVFVLYFLLLCGSCHSSHPQGVSVSSPRQPVHPSEKREIKERKRHNRSPLLDLAGPALYALSPAANLQARDPYVLHAQGVGQPLVRRHAACVRAFLGDKLEHRRQEVRDALGLPLVEVVLLLQDVGQRPVAQAVNVAELALAGEDLLRPFA